MTATPDPYAALGVTRTATTDEIAHAYRALLRRHHPDTRPSAGTAQAAASDAALARAIAAYHLLRDPAGRAAYDRQTPAASKDRPTNDPPGKREQPPIVAGPVRWDPHPRRRT